MLASAIATLVFAVSFALPTTAVIKHRVMVVTIDGTQLSDWSSRPNLTKLIRTGATGLLSTRTGSDPSTADRAATYRTLGAGRRTGRTGDGSALSNAIVASGGRLGAFDVAADLGADVLAPPLGGPGPLQLPLFTRMALDPTKTVTVIRDPDIDDADRLVGYLLDVLKPSESLIVLAAQPPPERMRQHISLAPIAATGFGFPPGLLTSRSTRRAGIVTLADVAPTILSILSIDAPSSMTGEAMTVEASRTGTLERLDKDLTRIARIRSPLLRGFVWGAVGIVGSLALLTIGRRDRYAAALFPLLLAIASMPLALILLPILPLRNSAAGSGLEAAIVALGVATIGFFTLGRRYALAGICALTAIAVLADLASGGHLAARSPLSYVIASGDRFYGVGNELMGVVVGCVLVALARAQVPPMASALVMAMTAGLLAVPSLGAKLGSVFVTIPAFALLAYRKKPSLIILAMLEAIAAATAVVLVLAARVARSGTHFATASAAAGNGTFGRKISAALRLLALSYWSIGLVVFAAAAFVVWKRRGSEPLLFAAAIAIAGALAFNDAGTIAAAFIAFFVATAQLTRQEPEVAGF